MKRKVDSRIVRLWRSRQGKILFYCLLFAIYFLLFVPARAEINNTLAYSVSHTSSTTANDLNVIGIKTVAQTILAASDETWHGIVVYLDRQGLSASTDSVRLRLRLNPGFKSCDEPDTGLGTKRDAYIKVADIPDGDVTRNNLPPDSVARGYAVWFIFDPPINVTFGSCWTIFLNAPKVDNSNRINWFYGTNGYASGSAWYATSNEQSWTNYYSDMDFRVIKDKYALVAIRRFPFNLHGALTINSDIDHSSITYMDSLHKWLSTDNNLGGSWGQGLDGEIANCDLWFGRASTAESTGTYPDDPIPYYFHGLDTTSNYYKDSIDNYIDREWIDCNHAYVACDGTENCADSANVDKWLDYMLDRPSTFGKVYKGGIWVNHGSAGENTINFGNPGEIGRLGDSSGTAYHHAHKTLATGRFKFIHIGDLYDPGGDSPRQLLPYTNWQSKQDSLNINSLPFDGKNLRDDIKTYEFRRVGRPSSAVPDSVYKFFNLRVARQCVDSNWISVHYTHLGKNSGLTSTSKDSIRVVHDSASAWGLWLPSTKALFNQQAASAFAQITVDRPSGSKRRIDIRSLHDWSWGSRVPEREEIYYLTFICYAAESLIITLNSSDTLTDSTMTNQQDVSTDYSDPLSGSHGNRAMSWVGMYNRTAGRKTILPHLEEAPPAEGDNRKRLRIVKQLLSWEDNK